MSWRALTLKQPWAWAIVYADKRVENRTWAVPSTVDLPLRVMIHAGKQWDETVEESLHHGYYHGPGSRIWTSPVDHPIAGQVWIDERKYVDAEGCFLHGKDFDRCKAFQCSDGDPAEQDLVYAAVVALATITGSHSEFDCQDPSNDHKMCSLWAMSNRADRGPMHHWQVADVRPLPEPVPAKGKLGLWKPSVEIVEAVEAQL